MKTKKVLVGVFFLQVTSLLVSSGVSFAKHEPLPVKRKFVINEVASLEGLWNGLSETEKKLAFHLQNAGRAGRDLLFFQNHRHALLMKQVFERATSDGNYDQTRQDIFGDTEEGKAAFQEFMTYLGMFEDQGGPYLNSNRKVLLSKVSTQQITALFAKYSSDTPPTVIQEIVQLLTDPEYEVARRPEDPKGADLALTGGNIYQKGLTGEEVEAALAAGLKIDLNCQVVKNPANGAITCLKLTTKTEGLVGEALRKVVQELEQALPYATTEHQKGEIESFIRYFNSGDQEDFRQANIHWVRDRTESKIDFMLGFVEVYEDYKGNVGSWESMVQIVDPQTTQLSKTLATNAQYFENKMPYGQWKKSFPAGYSPPAMMVYYFQEIADLHSGGYNLPNFDDMRNDPTIGAKNVIRLPLPGESERPHVKEKYFEYFSVFGQAAKAKELADQYALQRRVLVLLHEIIGHGSGTYDTSKYDEKEDPISALGASGSALEEQRADLAALVFAGDPKLVEIGIYKSEEEALATRNRMYDIYLIDFLGWIVKQRSFSESHMRGHWLLINRLLAETKSGPAIGWANGLDPSRPPSLENQVLVVKNYDLFWEVCRNLLADLQDIKANRRKEVLETLFAQEAPLATISEPWAQAIIRRGENLKINFASFDQTWTINPSLEFKTLSDTTIEGLSKSWSKINYLK